MTSGVYAIVNKINGNRYVGKSSNIERRWNSISEIKKEHPNYHVIAIYSCCNGHKKTYRGFVWKKFPKI